MTQLMVTMVRYAELTHPTYMGFVQILQIFHPCVITECKSINFI